MKTIAFYNVKGGVGKTTSAVNIAYLAARAKYKTILWDLDVQSCASWYLGVDDQVQKKVLKVFQNKTPIGNLRVSAPYDNLEVIPADLSLRKLEMLLGGSQGRKVLRDLAEHLSEHSKLLILDCSPSLSQLSDAIFACSDVLVVPLIPSPLSLRAFTQLQEYIADKKKFAHLEVQPFFTLVDKRRSLHRDIIDEAKKLIGERSPIIIPSSSDLEKMGTHQQPVHIYAPRCEAAKAYEKLWRKLSRDFDLK